MAYETAAALYGDSEWGIMGRWVLGHHSNPDSELYSSQQKVVWGRLCGFWGSVVTSASVSPLSSGAGSPWLIKMQGTGWQAAAAAYRQNLAEKGQRDGGGGWGKTNKRRYPPTPYPLLPRFGVLIP